MDTIRVVEIGGTHIRRADVQGENISNLVRRRTAEVLVNDVLASLDEFSREDWSDDIQSLVILVAGPVVENVIQRMPNFPAFPENIDLAKELKFDIPIFVFNDMTAAVTGMAKLMVGGDKPFWGLTWSTGLGGKFWDGQKITVDREIGHEIVIDGQKAEGLLGGRHIAEEAGRPPEEITDQEFYIKKAQLMGKFLLELDKIAPSTLFVFKGAIAQSLLVKNEIRATILSSFNKKIEIMLSPEPDKDSFLGAYIMAGKAL